MVWQPPSPLPTFQDVLAASKALSSMQGAIHRTPILRSRILDEIYGKQLYFKAENFQKVGAFKARGALYAVSRYSPLQREKGLITYSSGNHGQALAYAARWFGCRATIFMPTDAPAAKVAAVRRYGGQVVFAGRTSDERKSAALEEQSKTAGLIIEPFDSPEILAGQGTAGLELFEDVPELDHVYVPVGGGGLCSGIQLAASGIRNPPKIVGVEPELACSWFHSREAGVPISITPGDTIADGLRPVRVGSYPFAILKSYGAEACRVKDEHLEESLRDLLNFAKILVEPSGVAGLAAAKRGPGSRVGVILSGGNVDLERLAKILLQSP